MLKLLLVLLLVANALLAAWQADLLSPWVVPPGQVEREPARLQRQVNADRVQVLAPAAASAALKAAEAARKAQAAAAGATTACLEAGPIAASDLPAAEKALQAAGLPAGSWAAVASQAKGGHLVYMGRFADDDAVSRKLGELKRLGVDAQPLPRSAGLYPGLVLGRYDDAAAADAALQALTARGVRTARVAAASPAAAQLSLRVAAADTEQQAKLAALKLPPGQLGFVDCAPTPGRP